MPTNQLTVDLVVNDAAANKAMDNFSVSAEKTVARINAAGKTITFGQDFDKQLAIVEHRTADIRQQLFTISNASVGVKGFDGLSRAAQRTYGDLGNVYNRLRQIEIESGKTTDPAVLRNLANEATVLNSKLDVVQNKIDRVSAGRSAALNRAAAAGTGGGAGRFGAIAGAASAFLPFEAQAGLSAAEGLTAAGVGAASLAVFGGLAVAGIALVKISRDIRAEAEARLKTETDIAVAMNKQIFADREIARNLAEQKTLAGAFKTETDEQLRARQRQLEQFTKLGPGAEQAAAHQQTSDQIQGELDARVNQRTAKANAEFEARNESFKRSQADAARATAENLDKGVSKVQELAKASRELFTDLFNAQGESNPFVKVFSDAALAIENTRKVTRGLNGDLRSTAEGMTRTANANSLFSARLDSALKADELRSRAEQLRGSSSTPFIDPRILGNARAFDAFSRIQFENLALAGNGSRLNSDSLLSTLARAKAGGQDENATIQERFDRQLAIINRAGAENEQQRSEADRRLLSIGENLDPRKLNDASRDAIAAAAEREAVRTEGAEKDAIKQRDEQAKVFQNLDKNLSDLLDIARSDGLTGVIRIINEAENRASVELAPSRPSDGDVARQTAR